MQTRKERENKQNKERKEERKIKGDVRMCSVILTKKKVREKKKKTSAKSFTGKFSSEIPADRRRKKASFTLKRYDITRGESSMIGW